MKIKDWGRGRGRLIERGLINFPPLKKGGLLERGGLFERRGLNRGFTISMLYKVRYRLISHEGANSQFGTVCISGI